MSDAVSMILDGLVQRYPTLGMLKGTVHEAFITIRDTYRSDGKLLVCGNGGSAADAEHIAGELLKGFLKKRPLNKELMDKMREGYGERGWGIAANLQQALPTIALTSHVGLSTAFNNDVDPTLTFAQQTLGFGRKGDTLLGISTSGNSKNVVAALITAKTIDMKTIGLTGESGGEMAALCDVCIRVPAKETYIIQEYHLPVYHCLCAMLEEEFFSM